MCEHKFMLVDTIKKEIPYRYVSNFKSIRIFFCEKCLEQKNVTQEQTSSETPEWF